MKINPIAVQNYQAPTRREQTVPFKPELENQPGPTETSVKIDPQQQAERPRLAVKPQQAPLSDNLSPEEQRAVELLFSRFRDVTRFGSGYAADAAPSDEPGVGNVIDLKA